MPPVRYEPCPGYERVAAGCYDDGVVYVAETGDRETLQHELGHDFDERYLTDDDRRWLARKVGLHRHPWRRAPGQESSSERFADVYAACTMHVQAKPGRMRLTGYGFVIQTDGRYRDVCLAIRVLKLVRQPT